MRAATITGPRTVAIDEVALPECGPHDVVVDVGACGICGSNLHEWREPARGISPGKRPVAGASGHELVGVVVQAGSAVELPRGTRVAVEPQLAQSCGACSACERGRAWFCPQRRPLDVWGFAEQIVLPARAVFTVPERLSDVAATLTEPMGSAVHALRGTSRALTGGGRIDGASVAVLGCGVAGLLTVRAARHLGADRVVAVARYPHQARMAPACGADRVLDSIDPRLQELLKEERPDIVVEAVGGTADTFDLALRAVAPGGDVAVLGLFERPQQLDVRRAVWRELRLWFPVAYGVGEGVHDFEIALRALEGAADTMDELISHRFPLEETGQAFETAADKQSACLRVVVVPTEDGS
jgi:2-desacetyl-2-hydroxyethyl bacteriochlorophyllide A dehydrogenase